MMQTEMYAPSSYAAIKRRLAEGPVDFTAILCGNDLTAIGVIHALEEADLRIPDNVSVIGYDDIPVAALLTLPLTTMRVEREEIGRLAVRRLVERARTPALTPIWVEVACTLIERGTVSAAPTAT